MTQPSQCNSQNDSDISTKQINEKEHIHSSAPIQLSNVLHSTFGMEHYPNYLYRWNVDQISELEKQLLSQLKQVQSTKQQLNDILSLSKTFEGILNHNGKITIELINKILHTKLLPFVHYDETNNMVSLKWDWNMFSELMAEEVDDVYSFPLFDAAFCDEILKHTNQYFTFIHNINKINNTQQDTTQKILLRRRSVLDWMNLSWLNDFLLHQVINPITKYFFQNELFYNCAAQNKNEFTVRQRVLDWRHGYIIGYKGKQELFDDIYDDDKDKEEVKKDDDEQIYQRSGLLIHTDDSEITLNCCLKDDFEGGLLNIFNMRGKEYSGKEYEHLRYESELQTQITLKKGYAVIQRGRQLHAVSDVESGHRAVLIVWCRNLNGTRKEVCPCCWLNRRNDLNCICGKLWN
eukprot:461443_1